MADPTKAKQATNKAEVDAQDARTRLWQSLDYTYGAQRDESNKQFEQAYSQADRQALSRGMQRSSYNAQTLANLNQQKIDTSNKIYNAQIADYQNRLYQIERDEKADDQWERQFAEGQRQFNENLGFQKSEAQRQQGNWEKEFAFNQKQFDTQVAQWDKQFEYTKMSDEQKLNYNYVVAILGQGGNPSDEMLAKAGLSRADANAMKAQVKSSGGGGRRGNTTPTADPQQELEDLQNKFDFLTREKVYDTGGVDTLHYKGDYRIDRLKDKV